jgi:hypothetical protein
MRTEDQSGEISAMALDEARDFLEVLRARLVAYLLKNSVDQTEAMKFVSACSALVGLLKKPNIRPAIAALRKVKDTSLGRLLGFMHVFNLRFGPATTPAERSAYEQLFVILNKIRNEVLAEAKHTDTHAVEPDPSHVTDYFNELYKSMSTNLKPLGPLEFGEPRNR